MSKKEIHNKENVDPLQAAIPVLLALFFILFVGTWVFYRERMLFIDPCFVTFTILQTNEFVFSEHRYGAFITQLFPLIAGWLHLPLPAVLMVYSASFYFFYSAVLLLLIFKFRQYGLAILLAFYLTLMASDVYFWPNNEVHQGIAWMFLFFGILLTQPTRRGSVWTYVWLCLTAFLAIFSHFIVILPFSFLWLYFILYKDRWNWPTTSTLIMTGVGVLLFTVKYILGSSGWYDGEKLKAVHTFNFQNLVNSFSSGQARSFTHYMATNYWIVIVVFGLGIYALVKANKWKLLLLIAGMLVLYFVLICLTFPDAYGRELLFYMESQWMSFAIIAATPFVLQFLPQLKPRQVLLLLSIIFLIRLAYHVDAVRLFHSRYLALEKLVEDVHQKGYSKIVIKNDPTIDHTFLMHWGLPVESLTLSMIKSYDPPVTIKVMNDPASVTNSTDILLSSFTEIHYNALNLIYYRIDTLQTYIKLTPDLKPIINDH